MRSAVDSALLACVGWEIRKTIAEGSKGVDNGQIESFSEH